MKPLIAFLLLCATASAQDLYAESTQGPSTPQTGADTPAAPVSDNRPVVVLYTDPPTCTPCRSLEASIRAYGEENLPFRIERRTPGDRRAPSGFPIPHLTWGKWYHSGYEPIRDFIRRWEYANSLDDAAAAPTPQADVERIIRILDPESDETFVDYGCGDGRFLIAAARHSGCRAVGVEIDPDRAEEARQNVRVAGLSDRVSIITGDATQVDVDADVGVAYLYPETLEALLPQITKLDRFASYMHAVPRLVSQDVGDVYVWRKSRQMEQRVSSGQYQPYAVWQGRTYYAPACTSPNCAMCAAIRRQLGTSMQSERYGR